MVGAGSARPPVRCCGLRIAAAMTAASAVLALFALARSDRADAQTPFLTFQNQLRPKANGRGTTVNPKAGDPQMLVQADEIRYDYNNELVSAVGNVQIYYKGGTLEADKVIYDQRAKRLHAEGNARLTEPDGNVTFGQILDLSDDYRNGFVDSLRLETPDETRMAAARAERTGGNYTVFQSGVYTACEPCRDDPKKPPLWQVKAVRIIHDQAEKMMYFEDARIEFFGVPLAWLPYFSAPDPTVKRKTGFLMPVLSTSSAYGLGIEMPYYLALAPNYDATFSPRFTTTQGVLMRGEWRQRLEDGDYTIRGAAIDQLDKNKFIRSDGSTTPGFRDWRGSIESSGRFNLSTQWAWGWDSVAVSDPTFFQDYKIRQLQATNSDPVLNTLTEGVNQLYLSGRGDRSYFDIRGIHYYGFSQSDSQGQLPIILPLIDYTYTFDQPVLGGELGTSMNFMSLKRTTASFDPITLNAVQFGFCNSNTADTAMKTPANCLLRGISGSYTRASVEAHWRYQFIDPFGQVFTPFVITRGDVNSVAVANEPGLANFVHVGDSTDVRGMPTVGLEYHYPFIGVEGWGTQTIEPIAQVIVRPNEPDRKVPNEDAQSLVFDDTNLFKVDKFSGWDRMEGGSRANAGMQYTAQFNRGGYVNMLFGESYQLFGANSFAAGDITNTGLGSGLDKRASDYVARIAFQPNRIYTFTSRFRFDQADFTLQRLEIEGRANYDRWMVSVLYGDYAAQPQLGFLARRDGVLTSGAYKLSENWVVNGGVRYDIQAGKLSQTRLGFGYIDDCFIMSLNYFTDYTYSGNVSSSQTVALQISLRTIGGTGFQ
jgi:LPS-assembly protein